jgi:alpha-L-fucosidase
MRADGQTFMTKLIVAFPTLRKRLKMLKVQVKVKVKFTLEQATKAQRVRKGIALLFP